MNRGAPFVALLLAMSVLGVARVQPRLAASLHDVQVDSSVYLLPPPSEIRAMAFGYHAAGADVVWAKLIVEYGTKWSEHKAWNDAPLYMNAILALDPTYPAVYKFAEALVVYHPPVGTKEDWYVARSFLERGTIERPHDHEVWLHYGQFLAFSSGMFITDEAEHARYREEGARAIVHAVELGADPERSITAATLLSKYGKRDAAIRELRRAYALTDDDQDRAQIGQKLAVLGAMRDKDEAERDTRVIEARWRGELDFLSRDAYMLIGPITDPASCAGLAAKACPRTWNDALEGAARDEP